MTPPEPPSEPVLCVSNVLSYPECKPIRKSLPGAKPIPSSCFLQNRSGDQKGKKGEGRRGGEDKSKEVLALRSTQAQGSIPVWFRSLCITKSPSGAQLMLPRMDRRPLHDLRHPGLQICISPALTLTPTPEQ